MRTGLRKSFPTARDVAVAFGVGMLLLVSTLILGVNLLSGWRWENLALHSAVEMAGAVIALVLAYLLRLLHRRGEGASLDVWIGGALVGIGVLGGFHAISHAENISIFTYSAANLAGGLLFALVWLPRRWDFERMNWWPWSVLAVASFVGVLALTRPEWMPVMTRDGEFTLAANSLNVAGGLLMVAAAVRLVLIFRETGKVEYILFCLICGLFGAVAVMNEVAASWGFTWWSWHFLRLAIFGAVLWFMVCCIHHADQLITYITQAQRGFSQKLQTKIAEQKRVEVDIREKTRGLLSLRQQATMFVEASPTGLVMINDQGKIVLVNAAAERMFGYDRSDLLDQSIEMLLPEKFRSGHVRLREAFFASPEARRMGAGRELYGVRADGREFAVDIGLEPITTEEGTFVLSAIVDISEQIERQRIEREKLERKVEERTQELATANSALARSNLELEQFASVASHDLQEPLRKIFSYCQLLKEQEGERLGEEAKGYLDVAIDGAYRLQTLVRDLLSFARVTTRGKPLRPTDADSCLHNAISNLEIAIDENGAQVTHEPLPVVLADNSQLVHLFQNLIGNSLKYRGQETPTIHIGGCRQGDQFEFFVRDNGIGIDAEFHERIFGIFQRLHNRREFSGTGIGLALCKRIVERFGGRIWVESTPGSGSTFYFTTPMVEQQGGHNDSSRQLDIIGASG